MMDSALLRASWRSWFSQDFRPVGPAWLQLVWTFAFSTAVAVAFALLGAALNAGRRRSGDGLAAELALSFGQNLVVSLCAGYAIHGMLELTARLIGVERLRRQPQPTRTAFFIGMSLVGLAIGWPLGMWLVFGDLRQILPFDRPAAAAGTLTVVVMVCGAFYVYFDARHREIDAERRATEARLRLLQGQIEPHFLFNTLANVLSLMEHDTPKAREMLESFVDYLRSSLGGLRHDHHTLGDELALVEAYLRVVGIRMDDRLRWQIEVADTLRTAPLPPLTLQPLVENAIQHGLEPKLDGGQVRVRASAERGRLTVTVEDDGLGLPAPGETRRHHAGTGTACRNIRERLLHQHGNAAGLEIASALPQGVRATLTLPLPSHPTP